MDSSTRPEVSEELNVKVGKADTDLRCGVSRLGEGLGFIRRDLGRLCIEGVGLLVGDGFMGKLN